MAEFDWALWRKMEDKRNADFIRAYKEKLELAKNLAHSLAVKMAEADIGIARIILFGSVARGDPKTLFFDIDLCIEGAAKVSALECLCGNDFFPVDLVEYERVQGRVKENILREGVILYERA